MNTFSHASVPTWPAWFLAAALFLPFGSSPVVAGSISSGDSGAPHVATHVAALALPAITWWDELFGSLVTALSSQQRMLQFCAIGMAIALFVIWYRRP
jgi:hypothetical protein